METLCKEYISMLENPIQGIDKTPKTPQKKQQTTKEQIIWWIEDSIKTKHIDELEIFNSLSIRK
ncbi:MAG: hypothetical protein LBD53_07240, partial [Tannerella sp.]|nr:hypothetical protein [Tannerella sp.]